MTQSGHEWFRLARRFPPPWSGRLCLRGSYELSIHPNNREAVAESDCLWQSCTERTQCHISLAVSHQRRRHFLIPLHCLQLNQYQRQLPRLSPHVPPLIQVLRLPERQLRCQRQRYQPQRHSPPGREIGILLLAERRFGSTDRLLGKTRKTCADRALPQTMERLDRYRRILQT
jgi:hypothetical protein